VTIRKLGPGDEQVVERLAEQAPPERASDLLADEGTIFLVAFDGDEPEPVGFVAPEARRRGVAIELLRELRRIAHERGIRHGFVLTNEANEAAMELYRSLGGVRPSTDDVLWDFDY
jgi:GNAT superfamily N-acetyltransferase